jgi:hypothetical protein
MPELPWYGSVESCPKCGTNAGSPAESPVEPDASTVYHSERQIRELLKPPYPPCTSIPLTTDLGEHLCRTCQVCGFGWCEAVLSPGPVTGGSDG